MRIPSGSESDPRLNDPTAPQSKAGLMRDAARMGRSIRRPQLKQIVPLADTTIYDMEQRGEFPRRFYLTSRCAAWDLDEVEAWLAERKRESHGPQAQKPGPDVRMRKKRPVRS